MRGRSADGGSGRTRDRLGGAQRAQGGSSIGRLQVRGKSQTLGRGNRWNGREGGIGGLEPRL